MPASFSLGRLKFTALTADPTPSPDSAAAAMPLPGDAACSAVAVRALCEFAAKVGDLDLRFTPSPSGAEGVAGHSAVTARRPAGYQRELPLSARFEELTVTGRADGFDPEAQRVEEIKTHRGDANAIPPNHRLLHWAQARVYGWMLCQQLSLDRIEVALVYFNIDSGEETLLTETQSADNLRAIFENLCQRYIAWAREQTAHRLQRDAALRDMAFPFPDFRPGQRLLTETVYRAQGRKKDGERVLMAQAPTGIGKTMATLFGALKAAPAQAIDKIFYLTAKTPGRQLALDALKRLNSAAGGLRVLERVARDKACEHPDKACHGASCPLAQGFYDRLPEARASAVKIQWMDKTTLRDTALIHSVCPYYLGQEMVRWSDVLVGDFNHYFDHGAAWHALTESNGWRVSLLIDEAHNLIERARAMHSATLAPGAFQSLRQSAPPGLKKPFDKLHRQWGKLARDHAETYEVLPELPSEWIETLQSTCAAIGEHFVDHPADATGPLQNWWFEALHFLRVSESFGEHSFGDASRDAWDNPKASKPSHPSVNLRCVIPAPLLQDRWATVHSATLFSATLAPMDYVADLLGLPQHTTRLEVPSPFSAEQLQVRLAPHISTRWSHRQASLTPMADVMAAQFEAEPGNYLAFFSSFDYLQQALDRLQERHRFLPTWAQSRGMTEPDREAFIARFTDQSQGIGFAVLGGAFGEGIDLPGQRLIGAFIATLGLPQVNPVNEEMRARLQARFGRGYDYAYLYPGLQKVVQAAGRVIRSEADQGTVWLMDDRFGKSEVRRLLPGWWGRPV